MKITVLGLGNILLEDEGVGIRVVREVGRELPEDVEIVDGGTVGLPLMVFLSETTHLLIVDAVRMDAPAGTVVIFTEEELTVGTPVRFSVHDVSIVDLISLLKFKYNRLEEVRLVGIVPARTGTGLGLSKAVEGAVGRAKEKVKEIVRTWKSRSQRSGVEV